MSFIDLREKLRRNFTKITKNEPHLFQVDLDRDQLWDLYLDSFPAGTNEMYRERREYDCSCCRSFVKHFGNVVVIKNNKLVSIWDFDANSAKYQPVIDALATFVKSKPVSDVFISTMDAVGTDRNHEQLETGKIVKWDHLYLKIPKTNMSSKSDASVMGNLRDIRNVFKRSLDEITEDAILTVLELTASNTLYKGKEWEAVMKNFLKHKQTYTKLTPEEQANYTWKQGIAEGGIAKIRNHSIGVLLVDISENMDLDRAVAKWNNNIAAPENYQRSKPIFTNKQKEAGKKLLAEQGYMDSLERRFAQVEDISVNNILFCNKDVAKQLNKSTFDSVFDKLEKDIAVTPKQFSKVEEISIETFIEKILPTVQSVEVMFENKHANNMVSLITAKVKDSKSMFKWDNNFTWAYTGNITDSSMKERVKAKGGKVEGVLRFSLQWNDLGDNEDDLDAHCIEPNKNHIQFGNKGTVHPSSGMLDVDIINPNGEIAVENIIYSDKRKMPEGIYKFHVHNYTKRGGKSGFTAEIEFDGQIHSFEYSKPLRDGQNVQLAEVTFKDGGFSIKPILTSAMSSKDIWSLKTNQFHPVSVVMYSPNYWDGNKGHQHYFFMLKNCINPENPNGFYNEFLKQDLLEQKRLFEAIGATMCVQDVEDQLSGIGFSSTKRNELVVKVEGATKRMFKIKF